MPEHLHLLLGEPKARTLNVLKTQTSKQLKGDPKQFWQIRHHDWNVITHLKLFLPTDGYKDRRQA